MMHALKGHDRTTFRAYWTRAYKKKFILIIKKTGPNLTQVLMMPPQDFDLKTKRVLPRYFNGFLRYQIRTDTMLIFGTDEVLAQIPGANTETATDVLSSAHESASEATEADKPKRKEDEMATKKTKKKTVKKKGMC